MQFCRGVYPPWDIVVWSFGDFLYLRIYVLFTAVGLQDFHFPPNLNSEYISLTYAPGKDQIAPPSLSEPSPNGPQRSMCPVQLKHLFRLLNTCLRTQILRSNSFKFDMRWTIGPRVKSREFHPWPNSHSKSGFKCVYWPRQHTLKDVPPEAI